MAEVKRDPTNLPSSRTSNSRMASDSAGAGALLMLGVPNSEGANFKMCKKIAELTMVIHLLFKQNHENELTIHLLRKHYETVLTKLQRENDEKLEVLRESVKASLSSEDQEMRNKMKQEMQAKIEALETSLTEERLVTARLRELLAATEQEKQSLLDQLTKATALHESTGTEKDEEIQRLTKKLNELERILAEKERQGANQSSNFESKLYEMRQEIERLAQCCDEETKAKSKLQVRNLQLSQEVKQLRMETEQRLDSSKFSQSRPSYEEAAELEALRNELLRYKMELQNREENYNKVFSPFRPVRVERSAAKLANDRRERLTAANLNKLPGLSYNNLGQNYGRNDIDVEFERLIQMENETLSQSGRKLSSISNQDSVIDQNEQNKRKSAELLREIRPQLPRMAVTAPFALPSGVNITSAPGLLKRRKNAPSVATVSNSYYPSQK